MMSVRRGTTRIVSRRGAALRTALAAFSRTCSPRTTPNGSLRGSAGRQGASVSVLRQGGGAVPVLGQGRGERWLGCCYSQPLVQAVRGCRLSVMEAFGRISSSALPASSRCSHLENWFSFALASLLAWFGVWVLPVKYSVLDASGDPACTSPGSTVATCFLRALEEFTYFLRCGELES